MPQPLVSIIVPVYKVPEQYLRKCIESTMRQILKDIEIILVDDGSPDQCGYICETYAKIDPRIKVIHRENGGLSAARNTGFIESQGKWIMFVDGDDWIEPDMCNAMYELACRYDVDLVLCGMSKDYRHSKDIYKYCLEEDKVYQGDECGWLQQQLLVYNGNIAVAYAKLIKREILSDKKILHDEILRQGAEGLEFNIRLFEEIRSAMFINKPFYHYIYNDNSISATHDEANHEYVIKCFEKIRNFIEQSKNREMLLTWFDNRVLYVVITTAISGYFNPLNKDPFAEKKRKFMVYLKNPIVTEALNTKNLEGVSTQRRIILFLINHKYFLLINLLGLIRRLQRASR